MCWLCGKGMLTWIDGWLYCQICQAYMRRKPNVLCLVSAKG